jgi:hypothetical protein
MRNLVRAAVALALAVPAVFAAGLAVAPVRAAGTPAGGLLVSVGYAEDKETNNPNPAAFPTPWQGSPNTIFLGGPVVGQTQCGSLPSCFDAGAIRLDNPTATAISVSNVSVDVHSSIPGGKVFSLWGSFAVPAGQSVILTENPPGDTATSDDFDTSGYPGNVCTPITVAPTVTITVGGVPTTLVDSTHVLDTGGIDQGYCGTGSDKNESIAWRPIGAQGSTIATLDLAPGAITEPVGGSVTETATLLDGAGNGLANVAVAFSVTSGPNAGQGGSAITDAAGRATFTYVDSGAGTDIVAAAVTTIGTFQSQSMVLWGAGTTPTWTGVDIGAPPLAGSDAFASGVWTISGSGRDIGGTSDQFHFVSQPLPGDGEISARVVTQTNSNSRARAGVMLRQSDDPAAPFYAAVVTPGAGIWVLARASQGAGVVTLATISGAVPAYLRVDRAGSAVTASTSGDGSTWTVIPGSGATLAVSGAVLAGLAVTSHTATKLSTATFDSVTLTGAVTLPANDFSISASPTTVSVTAGTSGTTSISTAVVSGSAESIALSTSGLPTGVTAGFSPTSVSAGASSSLTFNVAGSVAPGTYSITVTGTATSATHSTPVSLTVPPNDFSISASPATVPVTAGTSGSTSISTAVVSGSAESIALSASGLPAGVTTGFSPNTVSAGASSSLTLGVAGSVAPGTYPITVTGTATSATHSTPLTLTVTAPGALPSPWADTDVGAPSPAGSASFSGGVYTVNGSGADIFGTSDQFNYVYQPTTGGGTIIARVVSQSATGSSNSKAGVIWKASTTAGSPYILIETGPTGVVKVQYNFNGSLSTTSTYSFPNIWMKLVRSSGNFSAYVSPDGVTWTAVVTNKSLSTIPTAATVGIFECSHKAGVLGTATFDNVSFTPGP